MFIPNNKCQLFRKLSGYTATGEPAGFSPSETALCSIVRISQVQKKTSVRADSSASRGSSSEVSGMSTLLFPSQTGVAIDDAILIVGFLLEIISVEPRFHISGKLDHFEVGCQRKESTDGITI